MAAKVLIANRGESELFKLHIDASITHVSQRLVAIRIRRSVRELGWSTAAVYLPNDASHAGYAEQAVKIDSVGDFMNVEAIAEIASR